LGQLLRAYKLTVVGRVDVVVTTLTKPSLGGGANTIKLLAAGGAVPLQTETFESKKSRFKSYSQKNTKISI
jgi:hypothetical protein